MLLRTEDLDNLSSGRGLGLRVALFGGSFDPPTIGHQIVGTLVSHLVDRVVFVPAGQSPLKAEHHASFEDRSAMTRLVTLGHDYAWDCWAPTVLAERPSYTIDVLSHFRDEVGCEPVLVIGSDCWREIHRWHRCDAILSQFEVVVISRPGFDARNRELRGRPKRGVTFLSGVGSDISSSAVRRRLAAGLSCRHMVPDAVCDYVILRGLYRPTSPTGDALEGSVGG